MMTVVIKRPVPAFLTKRWSAKKGILVASTFDTHFKWKIFDSSLRLALTFDIHTRTRRVPLGLRFKCGFSGCSVMLVCLRLAAGNRGRTLVPVD
jgi:hypothetical protein